MKKIIAVIMAAAVVLSFAACTADKKKEKKITVAKEKVTEQITEKQEEEITTQEQITEKEKKTEESKKDKPKTVEKDKEEVVTEEDKPEKSKPPVSTTRPITTTKKQPLPSTKAEAAKAYNDAVNKAASEKAGFKKKVKNLNFKTSLDLGFLDSFKDVIFGFLRTGDNPEETKLKGEDNHRLDLKTACLSGDDIKTFNPSEKNGKLIIEMTLNDGTTKTGSNAKAPVDKTGILVRDMDKDYIDHKTAENYRYAISTVKIASVGSITEKTTNVKVKAVIDKATGNPETITVSFNSSATLNKVSVLGKSFNSFDASLDSEIAYRDFKW